ncbi:efflux RND transporter permease subunit [bacterium]|nr:efflux RND transporter permease subunit [bacterium]
MVVFIPLMMLPGVMGKAMSLIPITIFTTLVASLFVSLTGTPTIFFLTRNDKSYYKRDQENEKYLHEEQRVLLESDRE